MVCLASIAGKKMRALFFSSTTRLTSLQVIALRICCGVLSDVSVKWKSMFDQLMVELRLGQPLCFCVLLEKGGRSKARRFHGVRFFPRLSLV